MFSKIAAVLALASVSSAGTIPQTAVEARGLGALSGLVTGGNFCPDATVYNGNTCACEPDFANPAALATLNADIRAKLGVNAYVRHLGKNYHRRPRCEQGHHAVCTDGKNHCLWGPFPSCELSHANSVVCVDAKVAVGTVYEIAADLTVDAEIATTGSTSVIVSTGTTVTGTIESAVLDRFNSFCAGMFVKLDDARRIFGDGCLKTCGACNTDCPATCMNRVGAILDATVSTTEYVPDANAVANAQGVIGIGAVIVAGLKAKVAAEAGAGILLGARLADATKARIFCNVKTLGELCLSVGTSIEALIKAILGSSAALATSYRCQY